jgi:hypothetical protein
MNLYFVKNGYYDGYVVIASSKEEAILKLLQVNILFDDTDVFEIKPDENGIYKIDINPLYYHVNDKWQNG